jgi:O-6-methylguanine DNA methyltransferase
MLTKAYEIGPSAPFGGVLAARTASGVCFLSLGGDAESMGRRLAERFPSEDSERRDGDPVLLRAIDAVRRYVQLGGEDAGRAFDAIPLDLSSGTEFQQRVWAALRGIPFGSTRSYGQIAELIGMTKAASRAVGAACGANPIALAVPCHRAIGAGGELVGFAWGGVENKRMLLEMESAQGGLFTT